MASTVDGGVERKVHQLERDRYFSPATKTELADALEAVIRNFAPRTGEDFHWDAARKVLRRTGGRS